MIKLFVKRMRDKQARQAHLMIDYKKQEDEKFFAQTRHESFAKRSVYENT